MEPFTKRMKLARPALGRLDDSSPLAFLRDWESPVDESQVGKITEPGLEDAYRFGQDMRKKHHYGPLLPPKKLGKKEHGDLTKKKGKEPKVCSCDFEKRLQRADKILYRFLSRSGLHHHHETLRALRLSFVAPSLTIKRATEAKATASTCRSSRLPTT